jgi:hypothetical protein
LKKEIYIIYTMQIFKKRLSVHRTSRNLRSLWDEYALQITAEGREGDSSRLLALSSFMDNIFDVGQPLEPTSLGLAFNFDDTAVVITGLLDVARRASIQLLTEECREEVDRTTLAEALRKALMVAKLCLKKCANREKINQVPHIVSLILACLENVASNADKVLSLQILGLLLQYEESQRELRRLGGLRLLAALARGEPALGQQLVLTLRLCLTPASAPSRQGGSIASHRSTSSDKSSRATTMGSCHQHSSSDHLHSVHTLESSESGGGGGSAQEAAAGSGSPLPLPLPASWPPLRPAAPLLCPPSGGLLPDLLPPPGTAHPSASLAAKGVNMAVNVVNEILRCNIFSHEYHYFSPLAANYHNHCYIIIFLPIFIHHNTLCVTLCHLF